MSEKSDPKQDFKDFLKTQKGNDDSKGQDANADEGMMNDGMSDEDANDSYDMASEFCGHMGMSEEKVGDIASIFHRLSFRSKG